MIQQTRVTFYQNDSDDGCILFAPVAGNQAYLMDSSGEVTHSWSVGKGLANSTYQQPDGSLFINGCSNDPQGVKLTCRGWMCEYDKHSSLIWEHRDPWQHHQAQQLDNGNIFIFPNDAYATGLHYSAVWELDPKSKEIIWQYHAKDNPQSFFSPHAGGCQRLTSGNTLVCEGTNGCNFVVSPNGEIVICLNINQCNSELYFDPA